MGLQSSRLTPVSFALQCCDTSVLMGTRLKHARCTGWKKKEHAGGSISCIGEACVDYPTVRKKATTRMIKSRGGTRTGQRQLVFVLHFASVAD